MTALVIIALVLVPTGSGIFGYGLALTRTDRTIAAMTPREIEALDKRVRARRALRGG